MTTDDFKSKLRAKLLAKFNGKDSIVFKFKRDFARAKVVFESDQFKAKKKLLIFFSNNHFFSSFNQKSILLARQEVAFEL